MPTRDENLRLRNTKPFYSVHMNSTVDYFSGLEDCVDFFLAFIFLALAVVLFKPETLEDDATKPLGETATRIRRTLSPGIGVGGRLLVRWA